VWTIPHELVKFPRLMTAAATVAVLAEREVKAGETVTAADARHLAALRDELGERFARGVVLYAGRRTIPFGERIDAVPISALWTP
jgi:predicted AAA+ superfamily ATPase